MSLTGGMRSIVLLSFYSALCAMDESYYNGSPVQQMSIHSNTERDENILPDGRIKDTVAYNRLLALKGVLCCGGFLNVAGGIYLAHPYKNVLTTAGSFIAFCGGCFTIA